MRGEMLFKKSRLAKRDKKIRPNKALHTNGS
jgi:hypothetical protein